MELLLMWMTSPYTTARAAGNAIADLAYATLESEWDRMKHKTMFRMLLKLIGVWVFVTGVGAVFSQLGYVVFYWTNTAGVAGQKWYFVANLFAPLVQMGIGSYLFIGGKWIADKAIPGNRPYCHECGYDLTNAVGHVCAECGTPFKSAAEVSSAP
jgi:hypothetical protein